MSEKKVPENIGVINPFALAEVKMKRRINWKRIASPRSLLEKTLQVPYDKLFDPKYESPLYSGLQLDRKNLRMERATIVKTAKEISAHLKAINVEAAPTWIDPGDFFEEGTEMTDPVQGALADCYFIAALSAVAWARPYVIAQRTRATGVNQQQFVDTIEFYKDTHREMVDVTELLPLQSPANSYIYARSSETGEIWPAIYEKAYAKWCTSDTDDQPDYDPIAYGDPVGALSQLTGLTPYYQWNADLSDHDIWQRIRANSISRKTYNPMVAWTHSSAPSPEIDYNNAQLVANHAYSILGWGYVKNQEYIILRNPWGSYEATLNAPDITWIAWDQPYYGSGRGFWRPIQMATSDGIFGLRSDTFKSYFAGFGWVQTPEAP